MFITFEGIEGSGKTTQRRLLVDRLREVTEVCAVREPGSTDVGEQLRQVLLGGYAMPPVSEACMVAAARAALLDQVVQPALAEGAIVICDRYVDTTYTIQGYGLGVPLDDLRAIGGVTTGGLMPDVTVYLDITPEEGHARKIGQSEYNDLDARALTLGQRYREGYRDLIADDPARWIVIDAEQNRALTPEQIHEIIYSKLLAHPTFMNQVLATL